ncbi:MAG TPA: hypothetical protein VIZ17_03320 [Acetobacteraceae bacterium]
MPVDVSAAALGEAMAGSLVQAAVLVRLVMKGVLDRQEAIELIDTTLLVLERHRQDDTGPGAAVIDHARSRLEALLRQIQATPDHE